MPTSIIGKKLRILHDDLGKSVSKIGIVQEVNHEFITIENTENKNIQLIPVSKIIKMVILKENKNET